MDDKFWYLKHCDLFERLDEADLARLEARARVRSFKRGEVVYLPGDANDSVLLLGRGRVKIYHITGEGKQAVLAMIDPGEMFGELAVFEGGRREQFAEAMETSTVILIPGEEMSELIERVPMVAVRVTRLMGLRRKRYERRLTSLLFRSNRERLVFLLLELAEKYGLQTDEGIPLGIKLSHQELASMIGSTRETVTVTLGELQAEGSVAIRRRQVILTQPDRLAASVDVPPPRIATSIVRRPVPGTR